MPRLNPKQPDDSEKEVRNIEIGEGSRKYLEVPMTKRDWRKLELLAITRGVSIDSLVVAQYLKALTFIIDSNGPHG